MNVLRRDVLKFLGLTATSCLLGGCPRPPKVADINVIRKTDPTSRLTIDVHCHIFNGSDLPMAPFGTKVLVHGGDFPAGLEGLADLIQQVTWAVAPNVDKELGVLARIRQAGAAPSERILRDARQQAHASGVRELQEKARAQRAVIESKAIGPQAPRILDAIDQLSGNYSEDMSQTRPSPERAMPLAGTGVNDARAAVLFLAQLLNYRTCNVLSYLETMSPLTAPAIDLLVPSLVDFNHWLVGSDQHVTATPLADQVRMLEQIAIVSGGRVHGMVAFDPLRHIITKGASFKLVQDAVMLRGCIGVKIYPPMGFAAYGNKDVDPETWRNVTDLPSVAYGQDFGRRLDETMDELFVWCVSNDVPVIAHTNTSNGQSDALEQLAGASYWEKALDRYKALRVDFGHLGDSSPVAGKGQHRAETFIRLMHDAPGAGGSAAYADTGYFSEAMTDWNGLRARLIDLLKDPVLGSRLMYGTDWLMNCGASGIADYRLEFERLMSAIDPSTGKTNLGAAFFGRNAANFYGLLAGQPARLRLQAFYARNRVEVPTWLTKVDA